MGTIVVGIDGSDGSKGALSWAANEAKLRDCLLRVAYCWQYPIYVTSEPIYMPPPDKETIIESARATAQRMIDEADIPSLALKVSVETPQGRPGQELVAMSTDSEMLVVGSRGAGSLREMLLGSVSNYCVHHSHCPVVIVRPAE